MNRTISHSQRAGLRGLIELPDGTAMADCPACGAAESLFVALNGQAFCQTGCTAAAVAAALNGTPPGTSANAKAAPNAVPTTVAVSQPSKETAELRNENRPKNPFERGLISAADLPPGEPPIRLWFGLYPATVALINGETGAGKSSLGYNLAIHAARNEPLFEVPFGLHRPLRVLYVDPENAGSWAENRGGLCALKVQRINQGKPQNLYFHDGRGVNLSNSTHVQGLQDLATEYQIDLLILDPIASLFGTKDENDNAEASQQMTTLARLSRETGACIAAIHHTGKSDSTSGSYGRGASARLAGADVGMTFRSRGSAEDTDDDFNGEARERDEVCRLQIAKNRMESRGSLFLRMAGQDRFERVTFAEWQAAAGRGSSGNTSKPKQARELIWALLADGAERSRGEIVAATRTEGVGEKATDDALRGLCDDEGVECRAGERNSKHFRRVDEKAVAVSQPVKARRNCETEPVVLQDGGDLFAAAQATKGTSPYTSRGPQGCL